MPKIEMPRERAAKKHPAQITLTSIRVSSFGVWLIRAAPVVAETMGGTMGRPQVKCGRPQSFAVSIRVKATQENSPITVPRIHITQSTVHAARVRPGASAGTTAEVAEPTERMPIETMPQAGSCPGSATDRRSTSGSLRQRAANPMLSHSRITHPITRIGTDGMSPAWVKERLARMPVPMTAPYQPGPAGGTRAGARRGSRRPLGAASG